VLDQLDRSGLSAEDLDLVDCLSTRFHGSTPVRPELPEGLAKDAVEAYTLYWFEVLRDPNLREPASKGLESSLRMAMEKHGQLSSSSPSQKSPMDSLPNLLAKDGFHALTGKTAPLFELMLWRTEKTELFTVELPGGPEPVEVVFLSDFVLRGWQSYATCGRRHSAGWTTPEKVFCVEDAYDRVSESFKVSLLAHEAQHHADLRNFQAIAQEDLEYRAKLVELALADTTQPSLLAGFASRARQDSPSPHARAEYRLMSNLQRRLSSPWTKATREDIRVCALALLKLDTPSRKP